MCAGLAKSRFAETSLLALKTKCYNTPAEAQNVHRMYIGNGTLTFLTGEKIECTFKLLQCLDGTMDLYCNALLSDSLVKIVNWEGNPARTTTQQAALKGTIENGAQLVTEKLLLNTTKIEGKEDGMKVGLEFLVLSNVELQYQNVKEETIVTCSWGLSNLEFFGCDESVYGLVHKRDKFGAKLGGMVFVFAQVIDYDERISNLGETAGIDVTCEGTVILKIADLQKAEQTIERACNVLSFGLSNWVSALHRDISSGGSIIATLLYASKKYPFNLGQRVIEPVEGNRCSIRDFLELGVEKFDCAEKNFGVRIMIELYVVALTQRLIEQKFLLGAIAFESLCSHVEDFAKNNGDVLESGFIKNTRSRIKAWLEENKLVIGDGEIEQLTQRIAYRDIGLKDGLRYLFAKLDIKYAEEELNFVKARGEIVHNGAYSGDLRPRYLGLLNLLDRTVLTMLGWKGRSYLNKAKQYSLTILE